MLSCTNNSNRQDREVVFSFKNLSERQKEIWLELYVDSSFVFFGPLYNDDIPDLYTVVRFKTLRDRINVTTLESHTDAGVDTTFELTKDISYISISYHFLPDTIKHLRFDVKKLDFVDSLVIEKKKPQLWVKKMNSTNVSVH